MRYLSNMGLGEASAVVVPAVVDAALAEFTRAVDGLQAASLDRSYVCLDDVFLCDLLLWVISGHCV